MSKEDKSAKEEAGKKGEVTANSFMDLWTKGFMEVARDAVLTAGFTCH